MHSDFIVRSDNQNSSHRTVGSPRGARLVLSSYQPCERGGEARKYIDDGHCYIKDGPSCISGPARSTYNDITTVNRVSNYFVYREDKIKANLCI